MNEHPINDPKLQSFEARLAALTPQLSAGEQQQLLYQCAFAAGRKANRRSVRRWQAVAALLAVVMVGWRIYGGAQSVVVIEKKAQPSPPAEVVFPRAVAQLELPTGARQSGTVELDAWQTPPSHSNLNDEVARFKSVDPHLQSLAVGAFTRALLEE
jgi:hypothetical protein